MPLLQSVDEALQRVLSAARPLAARAVPLDASLGTIVAEDIVSSGDSPPHDKALMDGFAVRASDVPAPGTCLRVIETITAGQLPTRALTAGTATQLMTGAPLPDGADAVVMVEQTTWESVEGQPPRIRINTTPLWPGQNILRRAAAIRRGETVIPRGTRLRAIDLGLLAEIGQTGVPVVPRPRVAVLATGNELVAADRTPEAGQIRNSNGPMLAALCAEAGCTAEPLGIARDDELDLTARIQAGLAADVLLLSGGVSAGILDLVPRVLERLGIQNLVHGVQLRPGKPFWFGHGTEVPHPTLVFALPGNPVSSLVCFELFVRPALRRLAAEPQPLPELAHGPLAADHRHRGDRPTFHPARIERVDGRWSVDLLPWLGSADLRALQAAHALAMFPAGDHDYRAGDEVRLWPLAEFPSG